MKDIEQEYLQKLEKKIIETGVSNEFLVSLLKLSEQYLNLKRISEHAKETSKSPQGIRKFQKDKIITVCNYQLIIYNE